MKRLLPERKKPRPQIIVTNLIDVMLLLVFFFMITSSFAQDTQRVPLQLPETTTGTKTSLGSLTVQVAKDGHALIAGKTVSIGALKKRTENYVSGKPFRPILVEADTNVSYGRVVKILDAIRIAGGRNVGLSTKPAAN